MKTFNIGEKITVKTFCVKNGKRPKCSMCFIEVPWYETGIKIVSSQMTGHLAFHQKCFDEFITELITKRENLK